MNTAWDKEAELVTEQDVYIDCAAAHGRANDLRSEASSVRTLAQSFQGQLGSLSAGWKGDGSNLFIQNATTRLTKLLRAADRLDELAGAIDQTASVYQQREIARIRAERASREASSGGGHSSSGGAHG